THAAWVIFGQVNIDAFVYVMLLAIILGILLLPDIAKRAAWIYATVIIVYTVFKVMVEGRIGEADLPSIIIELTLLNATIALFRRVSMALTNFEQVVEGVVIKPETINVLDETAGIDHINEELFRARRFERPISFLIVRASSLIATDMQYDMSRIMQRRYFQFQIASIIRSLTYKYDTLFWRGDDLVICLPETDREKALELAEDVYNQIKVRQSLKVPIGLSVFPEDGLIYEQLIEIADNTNAIMPDSNGDTKRQTDVYRIPGTGRLNPAYGEKKTGNLVTSFIRELQATFNPLPNFNLNNGALSISRADLSDPDFWAYDYPVQSAASKETYHIIKRVFDVTVILASAIVVLPVMLIIAILVWMTDRGDIFFMQERTGMGGERFKMFKFRTMGMDAEEKLKELAAQGLAKLDENGKLAEPLKLDKDPRVTPVGRILRKTSLDELPQLLNVLRGDMSLVGPRPTSWDLSSYSLMHTERLGVRPGITGLWQVSARGNTDFDNWVEWDMAYIDRASLSLDLRILVETVMQVIKRKGAR
ncbi:MAG: sugar transferase, partial [Chloroflexota bacterium]